MKNIKEAKQCLNNAWPHLVKECRQVLGSELHYQAMVYHCLRTHGNVPIDQIGMNVKMWVDSPISNLFKMLDERKHIDFRGGFEPIPDVCLFNPKIAGDWRRRNRENTLASLLIAIEVKASERKGGRLRVREIVGDIAKLSAHREEAIARGAKFLPVMMVIDTAREKSERMTEYSLSESIEAAQSYGVKFLYVSPDIATSTLEER